ncbi:MAG: ribonuclease HIII [Solobacterium sp.]|nr:ribonuclease HIII [Solobacterium sp.]
MANQTITLKLTPEQQDRLYGSFRECSVNPPAYARFQLRAENCVITCYESGKCVFQGKDAEVYASAFMKPDESLYPQAGSDEVGTGDYFGPVCVCASIVQKKDVSFLEELGVKDSKQITDAYILLHAPSVMERLQHSLLIVNNRKYNEVHKTTNMNAIKAKLHNQAYVNLSAKTVLPDLRVIDQFTPEASYYRYLQGDRNVIGQIRFETKAENKYLSVAASSMIARYAFLKSMEAMEREYDMEFVKGASSAVDECARKFVKRYGIEKLGDVAKLHFKNTEKL